MVSQLGISDVLRVELTPNGAFNVTEYGSDLFAFLLHELGVSYKPVVAT